MEDQTKKRSLWPVLLVVVILGVILFISGNEKDSSPQPTDVPMMVGTTTVSGQFTCLPHKDTSGPQTEECAFGLRDNSGKHYALDLSGVDVSAFDFPMDRPYEVTGSFVPIEVISSDMWRLYDVIGILRVSSYEEITKDIPVVSPGSTVILELKKPIIVASTTIRVVMVEEDSRCPSDVQCIQAGQVVVGLAISSPSGDSSMLIKEKQTITTETLSITLDEVSPYPISTKKIADSEYRFKVTIKSKTP
ncbi:MAG: hypothetical protein WC648_04340 [Candidatus Paceibacterota bacterium]|jgi:hypothetical protein